MLCKNCKKPIEITLIGLKSFCSYECKKAHRMAYQASWLKKKRNVDIKGGYIGMDSQNVDTGNPHEKPIEKAKNQGHGLFEDKFQSFGGRYWFDVAKKFCCNFEVRDREGYCFTLAEPIKSFKSSCSDCQLGQLLAIRQSK